MENIIVICFLLFSYLCLILHFDRWGFIFRLLSFWLECSCCCFLHVFTTILVSTLLIGDCLGYEPGCSSLSAAGIHSAGSMLKVRVWRVLRLKWSLGIWLFQLPFPTGNVFEYCCFLNHPCGRSDSWLSEPDWISHLLFWKKCLFIWEQAGGGVHFAAGSKTRIGEETQKAIRMSTNCFPMHVLSFSWSYQYCFL